MSEEGELRRQMAELCRSLFERGYAHGSAGNVSAHRACQNVHILIDQLDPPKWPRTAAALPVEYETDGTALHGPDGLGGTNLPASELDNWIKATAPLYDEWVADMDKRGANGKALLQEARDLLAKYKK